MRLKVNLTQEELLGVAESLVRFSSEEEMNNADERMFDKLLGKINNTIYQEGVDFNINTLQAGMVLDSFDKLYEENKETEEVRSVVSKIDSAILEKLEDLETVELD